MPSEEENKKEIWKGVVGWEDYYEVSSFGRVKSLRKNTILVPVKRNYGMTQDFSLDGKQPRFLVHRLVAFAFLPNPSDCDIVKHIDGNMENNKLENLKWEHSKTQKDDSVKSTVIDGDEKKGIIWKDVVGFEGLYKVSNKGQVYSVAGNKIMKQTLNGNYYAIQLTNSNKRSTYFVHRLVAMAFVKNIENKEFVNHIDRNGKNNNLENLEWVTPSENSKHAAETQKHPENSVKQLENYDTTYNGEELFNIKFENTTNFKITKSGKIYNVNLKRYVKPLVNNSGYLTVTLNKKILVYIN